MTSEWYILHRKEQNEKKKLQREKIKHDPVLWEEERAKKREYYAKNPEKYNNPIRRECSDKWASDHPEKIRSYQSKYYYRNQARLQQYANDYYAENKPYLLLKQKEYRDTHKDEIMDYHREWAERNPDKISEYRRRWKEKEQKKKLLL
jgi:hypothetical protein